MTWWSLPVAETGIIPAQWLGSSTSCCDWYNTCSITWWFLPVSETGKIPAHWPGDVYLFEQLVYTYSLTWYDWWPALSPGLTIHRVWDTCWQECVSIASVCIICQICFMYAMSTSINTAELKSAMCDGDWQNTEKSVDHELVVEQRVVEAVEWNGIEKKEKNKGKNSNIITII